MGEGKEFVDQKQGKSQLEQKRQSKIGSKAMKAMQKQRGR